MRFCLVCKVPFIKNPLCDFCLSRLSSIQESYKRDEKLFPVHSLFSWRPLSPPALGWLVKSLKRREGPHDWRPLAIEMINQFGRIENAVFVPIPSHQKNHSLGLARALADLTGFEAKEALAPGENHEQKLRSRLERQEVYFERQLWSFCTEYTNVIVVDDVVTTGATIRAAFHALGRPKRFQAWCLLDRRPCAPRRALL